MVSDMATRRAFLKKSAVAGAIVSNPYIWTSNYARAQDANSKLTIGSIGVGGQRGRYSRGGKVATGGAGELGQENREDCRELEVTTHGISPLLLFLDGVALLGS